MPLTPGSLAACLSRLILSSAAASRAAPLSLPSTSLRSSSGILRCELVVVLDQFSGACIQGGPTGRSLMCECRSSRLCSPSGLRPGDEAPSQRVSLNVERTSAAVWGLRDCSQSEYPIRIPSLQLRNPPEVCRTCSDRQHLLGDNHSDDEFNIPTNIPGQNRGSHFPPLAGLPSMYKIFSPNSRIGVLPLPPCSLCVSVFCRICSSDTRRTPPPSTVSLNRAGL